MADVRGRVRQFYTDMPCDPMSAGVDVLNVYNALLASAQTWWPNNELLAALRPRRSADFATLRVFVGQLLIAVDA